MQLRIHRFKNSSKYDPLLILLILLDILSSLFLLTSNAASMLFKTAYIIYFVCLVGTTIIAIALVRLYLNNRIGNSSPNDNQEVLAKTDVDFLIGRLRSHSLYRIRLVCLMTIFYIVLGYFIWISLSIDTDRSLHIRFALLIPLLMFELTFIWSLLWWPWKILRHLRSSSRKDLAKFKVVGSITLHKLKWPRIDSRFKIKPRSFSVGDSVFQNCFARTSSTTLNDIVSLSVTVEFCNLLPHVPIRIFQSDTIIYDQTAPSKYNKMVVGDTKEQLSV